MRGGATPGRAAAREHCMVHMRKPKAIRPFLLLPAKYDFSVSLFFLSLLFAREPQAISQTPVPGCLDKNSMRYVRLMSVHPRGQTLDSSVEDATTASKCGRQDTRTTPLRAVALSPSQRGTQASTYNRYEACACTDTSRPRTGVSCRACR